MLCMCTIHCVTSEWSAIEKVGLDVGGNFLLPPVSVVQQLLLVVEQLLVCLCGELKVGSLGEGERRKEGESGRGGRYRGQTSMCTLFGLWWRSGERWIAIGSLLASEATAFSLNYSSRQGLRQHVKKSNEGGLLSYFPSFTDTHLYNGVHGAGLLAKATVDALCHVNVVSSGSSAPICPHLGFNCDCLPEKFETRQHFIIPWCYIVLRYHILWVRLCTLYRLCA